MSESAEHIYKGEEAKLHDNGGCVQVHSECFGYKEDKCCYRYQSREFAKTQTSIFDLRSDAIVGAASIATPAAFAQSPLHFGRRAKAPQQIGDWHVSGPLRPKVMSASGKQEIAIGTNFQKNYTPYWNEAHHVISKGEFGNALSQETGQKAIAVRVALMKAGFNIHNQKNMQTLPMDPEVGRVLGLPTHRAPNKWNHKIYDTAVRSKLNKVFDDFSKAVNEKNHTFAKPNVAVQKLYNVAKDLRKLILSFAAGVTLDTNVGQGS